MKNFNRIVKEYSPAFGLLGGMGETSEADRQKDISDKKIRLKNELMLLIKKNKCTSNILFSLIIVLLVVMVTLILFQRQLGAMANFASVTGIAPVPLFFFILSLKKEILFCEIVFKMIDSMSDEYFNSTIILFASNANK